MSKRDLRAMIDDLFINSYPTEPSHRTSGSPSDDFEEVMRRRMEIHVTRSHFGDLLIVSADTGRTSTPSLKFGDDLWLDHTFPQCNTAGGWRTRFSWGSHELGEPHAIVALFYRARPDEICDHEIMQVKNAWALIVLRSNGEEREVFMQAPMPTGSVGILTDDGLEATHHVLIEMLIEMRGVGSVGKCSRPLSKLNEDDVPKYVAKALRKWARHVAESFGQGRI